MSTKPPTLYSYNECPFAMRARVALIMAGIQCEVREVNLHCKPEELLNYSPKGTVPVLVLHDGTVFEESLDIMHYALGVNDPEKWLDCEDHADLIERGDKSFFDAFKRYKTPGNYPGESWQTCAEFYLSILETTLYNNKGYLDENQKFTFKDAAILPLVYRLALLDESWWNALPFHKTKIWLSQFKSSDVFKDAIIKREVWKNESYEAEWLLLN